MRFSPTAELDPIIDGMLAHPDAEEKAKGENIRWERRVSEARIHHFENAVGRPTADDFDMEHAAYVRNHINVRKKGEPACFGPDNALALIPELAPSERLLRVEDMTGWAEIVFGAEPADLKDPDKLKAAFDAKAPEFRTFLESWNDAADWRPMFATVAGELDAMGDWFSSWWTVLPERLGLGHLSATPEHPRAIALMDYPASRVLDEPGAGPATPRFAAPTVIDHHLNSYFCPSPTPVKGPPICYGRAVNLAARGTLVCEMIHRHISYRLEDVRAIVVLTEAGPWATVPEMRGAHLAALRGKAGWAAFGAE